LDGGVVGFLGGLGDHGPDGIEIDVGEAREHGLVIQQGLGLETALPEAPGARVLLVGQAGDALVETARCVKSQLTEVRRSRQVSTSSSSSPRR